MIIILIFAVLIPVLILAILKKFVLVHITKISTKNQNQSINVFPFFSPDACYKKHFNEKGQINFNLTVI